ncbi:MAG: ACP S-malonyltransferase [Candidatus Omnitrophota bacterium]
MVAYLFAGQGSQYIGMGKDFYDSFPESRAVFDRADKTLGFALSELCFAGPIEELTKTNNSQPAILTVSIAALEAFRASIQYPVPSTPSFTAGLSLGEYSALVAAGVISFEDAVYLTRKRGQFMEDQAQDKPGKMLTLIGLDLATVKHICAQAHTEIANVNCPGQIVISGGLKEIDSAGVLAKDRGAKMAVPLAVSGAFHSSFMQGAGSRLAAELSKIKLNLAKIPVIFNVTAKPAVSIEEIKDNLIRQVSGSVLWEDSMRFMLGQGVNEFFEFGPGKVLKGLMRRIDINAQVATVESKEDIEKFAGSR